MNMNTPRTILALVSLLVAASAYAAGAAVNWGDHCAKCHGEDGKGQTKMGKKLSIRDFSDQAVQDQFSDEQAMKAMKSGVTDEKGKTTMKPIEGLSDEEMQALVVHVRSLKK